MIPLGCGSAALCLRRGHNLGRSIKTLYLFALIALLAISTAFAKIDYKKWLNEEVVWIISKTEREQFGQLKDDGARDAFIEEFWRRRDPTPSTARNECKEEHYRRLAYATQAFQEGIPGWKTDRGRIYILHGKPDEEHFMTSRSTISPTRDVPSTQRSPNTITWAYHSNENARYYRGEMILVFQPASGLSRQDFVLGESQTAQEKAEQLSRHFGPAADQNWMEADVRYRLIVAGPPALVNAKGAELPTSGGGELAKYVEDLFRSPGEFLEDKQTEIARRERSRAELRSSVKSSISYQMLPMEVSENAFYRSSGDWLVPILVDLPAKNLRNGKIDLYAALLRTDGKLFDEFLDSVEVQSEQLRQSGQERLHYFNTFSAPSGEYTLKVVVREADGKRTGYRETALRLDSGSPAKVKLGPLLLTNRAEVLANGNSGDAATPASAPAGNAIVFNDARLLPNPAKRFRNDESLFLYFQVWVPRSAKDISINANFILEGQIIKRLAPRILENRNSPCIEYGTVVPLTNFAPGNYILQIQALDHASKNYDIQRSNFSVNK
ncbi:MAG TPA: GWxTD domain-containing protein [Acidobacteriota bacterium]|nr:GWxTD domain-containing protein [Acidobacteriota bacterium]